ncbi:hypothetical protein OG568_47495 [Streptomyces sp. NBC_01450]|uniref:hypothetical protein n=1 Tax=Streptomyces sp. NBC_01450 TaxID=2903871 RepID=UPI002E328B48|nr:hypothetical protein [Streptomyces sp. NBC_01450]
MGRTPGRGEHGLLRPPVRPVYAGVRNPDGFRELGIEPLCLDVTDENQITDAVTAASDAAIVINNAGIQAGPALLEGSLEGARREMEVTLDAIGRDEPEILVDELSRRVRAALSGPVELLEPTP